MTVFRKILIGTDLSAEDRPVVNMGMSLSAALGGRHVLVHAFTNDDLGYAATLPVPVIAATLDSVRRKLAAWAGAERDIVVRVGDPREIVLTVADEVGADLIVLGTHARRGIGRVLLGSVAESVTRRAHCPVLVLPRAGGSTPTHEPAASQPC